MATHFDAKISSKNYRVNSNRREEEEVHGFPMKSGARLNRDDNSRKQSDGRGDEARRRLDSRRGERSVKHEMMNQGEDLKRELMKLEGGWIPEEANA